MATLKAGFTAVGDPERVAHRARSGHARRCAPRKSVANIQEAVRESPANGN